MSLAKTWAPSAAMASVIAWPMPSAAPVTTAILPCKRPMGFSSDRSTLEFVEGDGGDDDGAGDNELPFGRKVQHAETIGQERQDQHADRRAEQTASASGQADAAQDDRSHDLELEAKPGDMDGRAEPRAE